MTNHIPIQLDENEKCVIRLRMEHCTARQGECWIWTGAKNKRGYGNMWYRGGRMVVHRMSYSAFVGTIPDGLTLDHLCKVPSCVNPSHLEPVTYQENILRGNGLAAQNANKRSCKNGHEYGVRMVRGEAKGRYCVECKRIASRNSYAAKRAAAK